MSEPVVQGPRSADRATVKEPADWVQLNDRRVELTGVALHTPLLDLIRNSGFTGAKEGCAEGECGACAVLLARPGVASPTEWVAVNACLVPAAAAAGQQVITAEGLGGPDNPHPVQRELAQRGGSQCGYCTPGFVCSMAAEFYRPDRSAAPADEAGLGVNGFDPHALSGNLCRCTGYRPILEAAQALGTPSADDPIAARCALPPPESTTTSAVDREFVRPGSLDEAVRLLHEFPEAVPIAGGTDWAVEVNLRARRDSRVVALDRLPELRRLTVGDTTVEIGAALTLTEIERRLGARVPLLAQLWPQFASRLIRNSATLGGNLGTGSPIGDAAPALLALDARLLLVDRNGRREIPLSDYFTGYRRSVRRPGELIEAIRIPRPLAAVTAFYKVAKRRYDDISSVAVAFALDLQDGLVRRVRIGLGGVAATPIRALRAESVLTGRPWSADTIEAAAAVMAAEATPLADHRASAEYRTAMLGQSLAKFYAETAVGGGGHAPSNTDGLSA